MRYKRCPECFTNLSIEIEECPSCGQKVKKSIDLLETLKLITREESGKWIHTDRTISTPSEVISVAVIKYHQEIISLSKEAIERFRPEERDIRSVTLGVTKKGAAELKKRMEAFWKEILSYSDTQDDVEQVLQVNMQLFPLSIIKEKKNGKKGS